MAPPTRTQAQRSIAVASPLGEDKLLVRSVTVAEQLGRPFTIDLDLLSEDHGVIPTDVLGQNMTVRVEQPNGDTRFFNGYVSRWVHESITGGMATYRVVLSPWLWLLTRTANCRIFQEKTIPEIIKQVFRDHGFSDFDDKLQGSYEAWDYCVQYRESDFNFVSRLMEQEGIYYWFKHEDGKHTMVLVDSSTAHQANPKYEEIAFHQPDRVIVDREFITAFSVEHRVQTGTYAHTDYDFIKPKTSLETKSKASARYTGSEFEVFDFPGEMETAADGDRYAAVRMQEIQTEFEVAHAESDSRGIVAGCKFKLKDYPLDARCKDWVVVSTVITAESDEFQSGNNGVAGAPGGDDGGTYTCSFAAMDATTQFRPARITPKPSIAGPQTAIVCGKAGEEIWTDEHGRVKVMFHWDRESKADEKSSCWIRVSQPWAGKNWGAINLPRIGQEVIVEFLEGDPDRPIITGRVYNGVNPPPYALPDFQTQTSFKTNSSKGGAGFNELRFEDKKGEEQVFLHAEKNMDIRVKNDRFETIVHDRDLVVGNDKLEHVKHDRHEIVDNDHHEKIGRDRFVKVVGKQATAVDVSLSLTVTDDVMEVFKKNQSTQITKDLYIKAENICIEAGTNITIQVGKSYIAIESGGIKLGTTGDVVLEATGKIEQKATGDVTIEATGSGSFKGTSGLTLESPATAELKSASTTVKGDGMLTLKGGVVMIN